VSCSAIAALRAIHDLGSAAVAVTAPPALMAGEPTRQDGAEHRQLTVMFSDLVGSTALSTKLDPEDMRSACMVDSPNASTRST
jgi:class 3 adenylate cyclase